MSKSVGNDLMEKAVAAVSLHTATPIQIAATATAVKEEDRAGVTLSALDALENFAALAGRYFPGLGEAIDFSSLTSNLKNAKAENNNFGYITDTTSLSIISDVTSLLAAVGALGISARVAAPSARVAVPLILIAGTIAAAAFGFSALTQGDEEHELHDAALSLLNSAKITAESLGDDIASVFNNMQEFLTETVNDFSSFLEGLAAKIGSSVNDSYQQALNFVRPIDPLALDLDGDGIETIGANGTVLFDHDGDGVKHGTGWVGKDDALLVRDLNGNGSIDTGAELFGTNSQLADGTFAANGHQALADLDSNADGVIDANDAAFAALQVWQDANQDGISQTSELRTLANAGITSIGLDAITANKSLGNGNRQLGSATFTRADGTTGETASLAFAQNNFYREFTDTIDVPKAIATLPQMQGSGAVRDLQEAA